MPKDIRSWRMLFIQTIFNSIGAWTVLAWGQQYVERACERPKLDLNKLFEEMATVI